VQSESFESGAIKGVFPQVIDAILKSACGYCPRSNGQRIDTVLDLTTNGKLSFARKSSRERVIDDIDQFTQFSFPLTSSPASPAGVKSSFVPVVKYPGAILLVRQPDSTELVQQMMLNVLATWPIFFMNGLFIILSGGLVWLLVRHFP